MAMLGEALKRSIGLLLLWLICVPAARSQTETQSLEPVRIVVQDLLGSRELATRGALPYFWDKQHRGAGSARFEFRLPVRDNGARYSVFSRKIGATYKVWLDGVLVDDHDTALRGYANFSHVPRIVELPLARHAAQGEILTIEIQAPIWGSAGLSGLHYGHHEAIFDLWSEQYERERYPAVAVAVLSGLLGLFGWMLWWFQRESIYMAYAVAESAWSLRTAAVHLVDEFPVPWPLWSAGIVGGWALAICGMLVFILCLIGHFRPPWSTLVKLHGAFAAVVVLALLALASASVWMIKPFRISTFAIALVVAVVLFWHTWRTRDQEALAMSACGLLIMGVSLRDLLWVTLSESSSTTQAWLVYAWPVFGITIAWLLARRLHLSSKARDLHADDLRQRLFAQATLLEQGFIRLREVAEKRVVGEERQRILQDMHDGVGHELMEALQLANDGVHDTLAVARQIQRALDHLKLSVDVLQDGAQDISTMLGSLRYRLAHRLQMAQIDLCWSVDAIQQPVGWTTRQTRELQMLLYEAFSNLAQHSGASAAHFSAQCSDTRIEITLADNGTGLVAPAQARPVHAPQRLGQGIPSMQARAVRLGARLDLIASGATPYPGLNLVLAIPVPASTPTL